MRTLEDGFEVGAVDSGEGLRLARLAHGSCSCFNNLFTPVSHVGTVLLGIKPDDKYSENEERTLKDFIYLIIYC